MQNSPYCEGFLCGCRDHWCTSLKHWNQMVKISGVLCITVRVLTGHRPSFFVTGQLGCSEMLFCTLVSYLSYWCRSLILNQSAHSPPTSHINRAFLLLLTEHLPFFGPVPVNPRDGCTWKSQYSSFWNRPAFQAPTTSCIQSHLNPLSPPFRGCLNLSQLCRPRLHA